MFRHKGKTRTYKHNLHMASLLSFVAGIVNVAGFLAVQRLTTNVTGHFAYFVEDVFKLKFWPGLIFFLFIFCFLLGSFISNFIVEITAKTNEGIIYRVPIILESIILFSLAFLGQEIIHQNPDIFACALLFTMGLQNSLVTKISKATVRTTHLTGLFTDLGIELSQLFFNKYKEHRQKLWSSIKLRLTIISFFFLGGLLGGIFYSTIGLYILAIASIILITAVILDDLKLRLLINKRKLYSYNRVKKQ